MLALASTCHHFQKLTSAVLCKEATTASCDLYIEACMLSEHIYDFARRNQDCYGIIDDKKVIKLEDKARCIAAKLDHVIDFATEVCMKFPHGLWKSNLPAIEKSVELVSSIEIHIANYEQDLLENEMEDE